MGGAIVHVDRNEDEGKRVVAHGEDQEQGQNLRSQPHLRMHQRSRGQRRENRARGEEDQQIPRVCKDVQPENRWTVHLLRIFWNGRHQMPRTMQPGGKRESRASVTAGSLTLHDAKTKKTFLIDTGAEVSVVPASEQNRQGAPMEKELVAANGSHI